ncbi:MAG: CCA tRNA nucleotidyltransferase [Schleiferiaceae bacterium]|jgi:tRNA nucleotidyltransferase (CCA-adding enzyme)|nr:CCA tRNA nucleotidyltransferase [Schleiferiaceae bacterium]
MKAQEYLKHELFDYVGKAADELEIEAYVIGGYVRDCYLKRNKFKDLDFVAVGSGIELAQKTAQLLPKKVNLNVFKRFGTAQLVYKGIELEFVGARKESYSKDSRKPFVEDGSLQDDQNRRDFTINALAISINKESWGNVLDPFNGLVDLEKGIIRTPLEPNKTYSDDPLRMMRAIRFATQLDFYIEQQSFDAIRENKERIKIISKERIADELNKIMAAPKPSKGFNLLYKSGLLELILPELVKLQGVEEVEGQLHKDNFYHTLEVVDNISANSENVWLRWAGLLHDIAKPKTKRFIKGTGWTFHGHEFLGAKMVHGIFKRLKLPLNDKKDFVQKMVKLSSRPISLIDDGVTDSAVRRLLFDAGDDLEELMVLCEADITTKNAKRKKRYLNNFKTVREKFKTVEEKDRVRNFQPPVTGELIMQTFDLKPGPEIGQIKTAIKDAILEGTINNDLNEAKAYMIKKGSELGLKIRKDE